MPNERHRVLGLDTHLHQDAPARTRIPRMRSTLLGSLAGVLAVTSMALVAGPASAEESDPVVRSSAVANERLPRVTEPVQAPGPDGLLPWTTVAANDVMGYRASTYTGRYYDKRFEQYRLCVVQREGGGSYTRVTSGETSSFYGAYQFGTSYNTPKKVSDRLRAEFLDVYGASAKREINKLAVTPINRWNRFWQDAAFWTTFNRGARWSQWSKQWGANWDCFHKPGAESGWPRQGYCSLSERYCKEPGVTQFFNYSPMERGGENTVAREYRDRQQSIGTATDNARSSSRAKSEQQIRDKYGRAPAAFGTPRYSRWLARNVIKEEHGWNRSEFKALRKLWNRESRWNYQLVYRQANGPWHGLGQVNGPYINSRGHSIQEYLASPYVQIRVGAEYIEGRYGTPRAAWAFWRANRWY